MRAAKDLNDCNSDTVHRTNHLNSSSFYITYDVKRTTFVSCSMNFPILFMFICLYMASDFSTPQFHAINYVSLYYVWFANTIVA